MRDTHSHSFIVIFQKLLENFQNKISKRNTDQSLIINHQSYRSISDSEDSLKLTLEMFLMMFLEQSHQPAVPSNTIQWRLNSRNHFDKRSYKGTPVPGTEEYDPVLDWSRTVRLGKTPVLNHRGECWTHQTYAATW